MKKLIKMNSLTLVLVLIFNILYPIISIATEITDDIVTINFEDQNFYNAIIKGIEDKIKSKDDNN